MKEICVTIVSDELPKGCGLDTYHDNLASNLKTEGISVSLLGVRKLFRNYPIRLSSRPETRIVHFTDQRAAAVLSFSPFRRYKSIVTVHDIIEIINFKNVYDPDSAWKKKIYRLWNQITKESLKRSDAIIAVSEHTKRDLVKLGIDKNKISVIYEAAGIEFKPKSAKKDLYSVLYVGSNFAHKNLKVLLYAFSLVIKTLPKSSLILVGRTLPNDEKIKALIKELSLDEKVIFKGYVKEVTDEYSKAGVFVFPSLYEGFGLPVLEAMACGCPVICSDQTSLPEVGGDAAMYFDGHDAAGLAEKINNILKDKALQRQMIKKGFEQAKKFNWEKTAEETAKVYKEIINR